MIRKLLKKRSLLSALVAAAMLAAPLRPTVYAVEQTVETEQRNDTFTISISGSKGVDLENTRLTVKRGESVSVIASPATGYEIKKVRLHDGAHLETALVGTGQLLVAGKVYHIDEADGRVSLRLTNVQSDMTASFLAEIDADYKFENQPFTVKVSGEQGVKIDETTLNTTRGKTVDAVAYAAPGYQITKVRLEDGARTETALVSGKRIVLNGKSYPIENDSGYIKIHLTDIQSDISVYFYADLIHGGKPDGADNTPTKPDEKTCLVDVEGTGGIEIDNKTLSVIRGKDVNVVVNAKRGFTITSLRLQTKNHTAKTSVSAGCVWLGGEKYLIDADGSRITLRLTDVREDMSVYFYTDDTAEGLPEGYCAVTAIGSTGASVDAAMLDVKRGGSITVSAKAKSGYKIEAVCIENETHQKTADVSDGCIEFNGKIYRIDRNGKQVAVRLTDVQDAMTVRFYTDQDRKEQPYAVTVGGDDESKIERENLKVKQGGSADITAEAKRGYKIIEVKLDDGVQSTRAKVSEGRVWNGDKNYRIEESNGSVTLRLTDVQRDMSVFFYTGIDEKNIPVTISEKAQNCSIKASRDAVEKGGTVIYTVQPANGHSLDKITLRIGETEASASVHAGVIKVGSKSYKMQVTYDGVVTVTVDDIADKVELYAETVATGYPDAPSLTTPTYLSSVNLYLRADIRSPYIQGYGNGRFGPKNTLTRAEAATMLAGLTNYDAQTAYKPCSAPDVDQKAWYANVVNAFYAAAVERNTASFRPNVAITRGELAVWLYRLSRSPAVPSGALSFPDTYGHTELNSAAAYGRSMGWINGYEDGMFRPDNSLIRAEAAKLLNRATRRPLQVTNYITSFTDVPYTYWAYSEIQSAANYV